MNKCVLVFDELGNQELGIWDLPDLPALVVDMGKEELLALLADRGVEEGVLTEVVEVLNELSISYTPVDLALISAL